MANNVTFPPQRKSFKSKNKTWRKSCVDAGDKKSFYNDEGTRQTLRKRVLNLNLYNGILDIRDMEKTLNPNSVVGVFTPEEIPHHPIATPKIDLLVGEEINRRFDWTAIVTTPDAISAKQEERKAEIRARVREIIESGGDEQEITEGLRNLDRYLKYDYKDLREVRVNRILKHYSAEQQFAAKFSEGFKDALILGEEVYQVDILHDNPILNKLNPLKVHAVRLGNSNRYEDADIVIIEDHWNPGKIIDAFYDEIKPKDIDRLNEGLASSDISDDEKNARSFVMVDDAEVIDGYVNMAEINGHVFQDYVDPNGNIRILRVYWKSQKLILKIKYYDEYGDVQYRYEAEDYVADTSAGEEVKREWVNEWWEGTKIGGDIYLKMRPRPAQFLRMDNPNATHCGIIGEIYNTNQSRAVSLMDRMRSYQYLYDAVWDRVNKAIAKNMGKIMELDLAKVPEGWTMDKWLYFAVKNGIAVVDSFKEGNKGKSLGMMAGNFNTTGKVLDAETGNYIQQHMNMLQFIKSEMSEIIGVTPQREGAVGNRETVGGVERSVNQSSHITEWWFSKHDNLKLRVLQAFIDVSKVAFKGQSKQMQYILDDQSIEMFHMDGDEYAEIDYGIVMTSSAKTAKLEQTMQSLAQAFMQNGGSFATVMDIYLSPSLSDMRRKIEQAEEDVKSAEAETNKANQKALSEKLAAEQADKEAERGEKRYKVDADNATKILLEQIKQKVVSEGLAAQSEVGDHDENGVDDGVQLVMHKDDIVMEMKKLQADLELGHRKLDIEEKKINKTT